MRPTLHRVARRVMSTGLLTLAACGGGDGTAVTPPEPPAPPVVATLELTQSTAALSPGQRVTLGATARTATGSVVAGASVTWRSTTPAVATVTAAGEVSAVTGGSTEIIASVGTVSASARVTVSEGGVVGPLGGVVTADSGQVELLIPPGAVSAAVAITVQKRSVVPGADSAMLAAYDFGPSGTQFAIPVTMRLRYPAGLSPDSVVQFLRVRRFEHGQWRDLDSVFVRPRSRQVEGWTSSFSTYGLGLGSRVVSVTLQPVARTLYVGQPFTFTASLTDANGQSVSAAAFDPSQRNGRLTWSGDAELQLSASGLSALVRPTVAAPSLRVALAWQHNTICAVATLDAQGRCPIGWEGTDTLWARPPQLGTFSYGTAFGTAQVTVVNVPVASVAIAPDSVALTVGTTQPLTALVRDSAGGALTGRAVVWSTSNSAIAAVSAAGVVTAVAPGTATITATSEGRSGTAKVVVSASTRPVTLVLIDAVEAPIEVAQTYTLRAVAYDSTGATVSDAPLVWTALDPTIATVSPNGVVTGVSPGTGARIRAASGGRSGLVRIDVLTASPVVRGTPAVGYAHACVLRENGQVWCWGRGDRGQLGHGATPLAQPVPVLAAGGPFKSVTAGGNAGLIEGMYGSTCALRSGGSAVCWGDNHSGQLGDGTTTMRTVGVSVAGPAFDRIWMGTARTCAVTSGGEPYCWGANAGATGTTDNPLPHPRALVGVGTTMLMAPGGLVACAVAGGTTCWGDNVTGMLGNGSLISSRTPVTVSGGHAFVELAGSLDTMCGRTARGEVWCWGANGSGGWLGNGSSALQSSVPVRVVGGPPFSKLATGTGACALDANGAAWCWGGLFGKTAMRVPGGHVFTELASGGFVSCGAGATGIWCWGNNAWGQLGNGRVSDSWTLTPVKVRFPN